MACQIDQGIADMEKSLVTQKSEHSNLKQLKEVLSQTHLKQMKEYLSNINKLDQKVSNQELDEQVEETI